MDDFLPTLMSPNDLSELSNEADFFCEELMDQDRMDDAMERDITAVLASNQLTAGASYEIISPSENILGDDRREVLISGPNPTVIAHAAAHDISASMALSLTRQYIMALYYHQGFGELSPMDMSFTRTFFGAHDSIRLPTGGVRHSNFRAPARLPPMAWNWIPTRHHYTPYSL